MLTFWHISDFFLNKKKTLQRRGSLFIPPQLRSFSLSPLPFSPEAIWSLSRPRFHILQHIYLLSEYSLVYVFKNVCNFLNNI